MFPFGEKEFLFDKQLTFHFRENDDSIYFFPSFFCFSSNVSIESVFTSWKETKIIEKRKKKLNQKTSKSESHHLNIPLFWQFADHFLSKYKYWISWGSCKQEIGKSNPV